MDGQPQFEQYVTRPCYVRLASTHLRIAMDEKRNNRSVERRFKECLKNDRARIQVGRISHFGLLEMSRQRIRTSVLESSTDKCPHCGGTGHVRSVSSVALQCLRMIEKSLQRGATHNLTVRTRSEIALYVLNHKRTHLYELEKRYQITITVSADPGISGQQPFVVEKGEQVHSLEQARARRAIDQRRRRRASRGRLLRGADRGGGSRSSRWKADEEAENFDEEAPRPASGRSRRKGRAGRKRRRRTAPPPAPPARPPRRSAEAGRRRPRGQFGAIGGTSEMAPEPGAEDKSGEADEEETCGGGRAPRRTRPRKWQRQW